MCGLTGFVDTTGGLNVENSRELLGQMTDVIRHRGPDDSGAWLDPEAGVAFGFRRLSIVDLSEHGHQPMESPGGRYVMVFNGEIYNYRDIRKEIERYAPNIASSIRGHSDTAVLLAAFECWGFEEAIKKTVGMFAIVVLDRQERLLHLCRDRIGEKPLYYGWTKSGFVFASELKSIRRHPEFVADLDPEAIQLYMQRTFIPAPYSVYKNARKLLAGTILTVPLSNSMPIPKPVPYWSVELAANRGLAHRFEGPDSEAVDELERILTRSVRREMVADVPLGAFLSGGVDSSLVLALMQSSESNPVKTFSIGFENEHLNEAPYAKAVANHLGTDHAELYVSDRDARNVIPLLPAMYDEPFADSSQIPTHLVSKLARSSVTVSLTGDGADELFGGYNAYRLVLSTWNWFGKAPFSGRKATGTLLEHLPWFVTGSFLPAVTKAARLPVSGDRIRRLLPRLAHSLRTSNSALALYESSVCRCIVPLNPEWARPGLPLQARYPGRRGGRPSPLEQMLFFDQTGALSDDMLTKVDRASMAVSLETRAPFLDHHIVEWSWTLPTHMKVRDGRGKWILRELLNRHVPLELVDRPKQGFAIPVGDWLRVPLRDWAEELMRPERLKDDGILSPEIVENQWQSFLRSNTQSAPEIWSILMFQQWLDQQGSL